MNTCLWMNTCLLMSNTHNFGLVLQWWRVDCRPARRCRHTLPKWIWCTVRLSSHTCVNQQADRFLVCNRIRILDCNGTKRKCKVFATFFVLFTDAYTDPRLLIRTRMQAHVNHDAWNTYMHTYIRICMRHGRLGAQRTQHIHTYVHAYIHIRRRYCGLDSGAFYRLWYSDA